MQVPHSFSIAGQQLWLSPARVIFWENTRTLILSDAHFGKTGHFRKAGIAIPQTVFSNDLQRLFSLIQYFQPERLIIVGDFFHSSLNKEADLFARWRADHSHIRMDLVLGNHDILDSIWYEKNAIQVHDNFLEQGPFGFVHEWTENVCSNCYFFSGHIHPGVMMLGAGRQHLMLPCFYFGSDYAILPAFGGFTGLAKLNPARNSNVFVIGEQQIFSL
jgi:DNA ligase-associated metallophosphoesterase